MVAISSTPVLQAGDYITKFETGVDTTLTDFVFPSVQDTTFVLNEGTSKLTVIAGGKTYYLKPGDNARITDDISTLQVKSDSGLQPFTIIGRVNEDKYYFNSQLAQKANDLVTRAINVKYPIGTGLTGAKGDGISDDYPAIKAIIDYAIANNLRVIFPTATYLLSQPLIYTSDIHLTLEGGDKENCKLKFTCNSGVSFMRGVVKMSNFQITCDASIASTFMSLQLGDTTVSSANDSLHWSVFSSLKLTGNIGLKIGNFFDSSLNDIDIMYLSGTNPMGVYFAQGNTGCASNNLVFNRLHVETTTPGGILVNFNAGSTAATANFVFNGCHFEAHELNANLFSINYASNITFLSCQFTHSGATGETVETSYQHSFILNNAMAVKFVACGMGVTPYSSNSPVTNAPRWMKLMNATKFIKFDTCQISPAYQPGNLISSDLFTVDVSFTGEYPVFDNCMIVNNTHVFDRFILGFNSMAGAYNKYYIGMGSDFGLHVNSGKWNLNSTPDDPNNYGAFSSFMQNGMFKTAGIMGRHSGTIAANTGLKVIAYNGRTGSTQSGLYMVNVKKASDGNAYSAIVAYNNFQGTVAFVYSGSIFSTTKDTAGKINIYHASGQLNMQNTVADDVIYSIVPFFVS